MKRPNTFAARARSNHIWSNSFFVRDSVGSLLRVTRSRRILQRYSEMNGTWEAPTHYDGFENRNCQYYATGKLTTVDYSVVKTLYPFAP